MCLVGIAWQSHATSPLILAANRDEFHARAAAPAAWWDDAPHVFGGRDLEAGGTWLAVARDGRFGVVTNLISAEEGGEHFRSRGDLIRDYLTGDSAPGMFLRDLETSYDRYRPFRLALGNSTELMTATSAGAGIYRVETIPPGIVVLTNEPVGERWPKSAWLTTELERRVKEKTVSHERLLDMLATDRTVASTDVSTDLATRVRSLPFIRNETYGTRASTVVTITVEGRCDITERRFSSAGAVSGESVQSF